MSRILFLDQYGEIGGGQTVLLSLLQAALATGAQVTVMAPGGGGLEPAIRALSGDILFLPVEEPRLTHGHKGLGDIAALLAHLWRFRRRLPELRRQDLIYVNGLRHLPALLLFAPWIGARVIYHLHIRHSGLEKFLLRLAARLPQSFRLVANARFIADDFGENRKLVLIENALTPAFSRLPFTDRFSTSSSWCAVVPGTLRPEKGQDIAIAAMPSDMTLHLVGRDGDGASEWISALRKSAPVNIHFDGPAADVPAVLAAMGAQFGLVPSRWEEPFGLAAIECMACSCLTIVSGRGGLGEIAEKTGALVAPDIGALSGLLRRLCERPRRELATLARAQYDAAQRHYGPERFAAQVRTLLEQALSAPR